MELFIPEKLIDVRKKIEKQNNDSELTDYSQLSTGTDELIRRLYRTPDGMQRAAALALSDNEAKLLAGYVPYNHLGIEERPLFEILEYRLEPLSAGVLFREWQNAFQNTECNNFLRRITVSNTAFQRVLNENHIDESRFIKVLVSRNIPLSFDEELVGSHFVDGADLDAKLVYYGVVEESNLDIECKRALLTFCGRTDYLDCSEQNLLDIISGYDEYMLRKFLLNFMSKMSLRELQAYPNLAAYLRSLIGHRRSETYRSFFSGVGEGAVQRFNDWINVYKINTYFGSDDRSRFWKQYRYLNVVRYPGSDTVIMEFNNYVAVEFLGEPRGTICICDKDVFRENFYQNLGSMNNEDLRLYFKIHKDLCLEYRNHTGRWQSHLSNLIAKREIAEKLDI